MAERFAYYGIGFNLINYLTGPFRKSTAVNFWSGMASMLPLLGAFVADSYLGRHRTIIIAAILYILEWSNFLCRFGDEREEAKGVLRLFPISTTCLIYGVVVSQSITFFTKQGSTLDRRIGKSFLIPPASLQGIAALSILTFIPIYDHILVPAFRKLTGLQSGITMLQRIGIGMAISTIEMAVSALVEMKRIQTAEEYGLVNSPDVAIPMSLWWLIPQYFLSGLSDVFTIIGLQEFFYDQVPDALRSLGIALYLSIFGVGSFISGFLVSLIDKVTAAQGGSWFPNNLNHAHLDYFYWLLAVLNTLGLLIYLYFARAYAYMKKGCSDI
ncbi:hypothetical protein J5N97_021189 [Dioscorea zingiberensis]|uniref:Uncharacterized protein n=1 Tax=Dioscorea zingiberensis TaxID=325984 RepID=A0A9D5HEC0_9LILI|nr:hypothetical protein J5N97_021189 [Dioscorea zingiberensis]